MYNIKCNFSKLINIFSWELNFCNRHHSKTHRDFPWELCKYKREYVQGKENVMMWTMRNIAYMSTAAHSVVKGQITINMNLGFRKCAITYNFCNPIDLL